MNVYEIIGKDDFFVTPSSGGAASGGSSFLDRMNASGSNISNISETEKDDFWSTPENSNGTFFGKHHEMHKDTVSKKNW